MFKKFKDKITEEMKQSPARIQASMHQLAQAVVPQPNISNVSCSELSASNDNFSLTEDCDETAKNSPAKDSFPNIDLTSLSSNTTGLSRSSSINSLASDAFGYFPIFDTSTASSSIYQFQSDIEQSASETDDCKTQKMDQMSKEQICLVYRKTQTKYSKSRSKYHDLVNNCREIEREKLKLESLLVETQNKALRRIANLKEQCHLEQQAKAHLEEALRNDIEEKDHIIDSLNTKVKLLQANIRSENNQLNLTENKNDCTENSIHDSINIASSNDPNLNVDLIIENNQLKTKLEKFEILISKYKESLKRSKEKIDEMEQNKYKLDKELDMTMSLNEEKLDELQKDLIEAREKINLLNDEINELRKREEESVISLAENKLKIHKELDIKEEQIKQLTIQLKQNIIHDLYDQTTNDEAANEHYTDILNDNLIDLSDKNIAKGENNRIDDYHNKQSNYQINLEVEKKLMEKVANYTKIVKSLRENYKLTKMSVKNFKENCSHEFFNVNKVITDLCTNYETKMMHKNSQMNSKLLAEVENLNFKMYDMSVELKTHKDYIKVLEEEKLKMSKENFTVELEIFKKLKSKLNKLVFDHSENCTVEPDNVYMKITEILNENNILKENANQYAAKLNKCTLECDDKTKKVLELKQLLESDKIQLENVLKNYKMLENDRQHLLTDISSLKNEIKNLNNLIEQLKTTENHNKHNTTVNEKINELMSIIIAKNTYIDALKLINKTNKSTISELVQKNNNLLTQDLINKAHFKTKLAEQMDIIVTKNAFINNLNNKNNLIAKKFQNKIDELMCKNLINIEELTKINRQLLTENNVLQHNNNYSRVKCVELSSIIVAKNDYINALKLIVKNLEGLIANKNTEIVQLKSTNDEMVKNTESNNTCHVQVENLKSKKEILEKQLQEAESMLITCQSKESQIESMYESLRNETDKLKQQLAMAEEEQRERMNQLVKEFKAQINDKDQELQAALDKKFERQKTFESDLVQQYKEQLKDFQIELTAKSEEIENLKQKNQGGNTEEELQKLTDMITKLKLEHEVKIKQMEKKCEELKEWNESKREVHENISVDTLKSTVASQQRELTELRKILKVRHDTLEDSTEIEYLRNILYEYMMGKETLVLAKVIAAVVKFDQEQTNKILEREKDKQTLLGSLGLSQKMLEK